MEIGIKRIENNIVTIKDYQDIKDRGEVCHIIAEIVICKKCWRKCKG